VIGGAMFGEIDVEQWKLQHQILDHSRNINKNVDVQLFEVFKLSYDDLEPHLKDCFFNFATYLENHPMPILELTTYCKLELLVPKDRIGDPNADIILC